jgi:hypothetical protein
MEDLQRLGAKSVPVVSMGDKFVFAQVIRDVIEFLELDEDPSPELTPVELVERFKEILKTAVSLVHQFPDVSLNNELHNRPRSWKVLLHHVFQIPKAFLDHEEKNLEYTYEMMTASPPENLKTSEDIANFGKEISKRFSYWWQESRDTDFSKQVTTYFGRTLRHELLERTVWHSTQHARQLQSLLESLDIKPDVIITKEQQEGLPLTEEIWDKS